MENVTGQLITALNADAECEAGLFIINSGSVTSTIRCFFRLLLSFIALSVPCAFHLTSIHPAAASAVR
jgi:hypothetical protein